MTKHENIMDKEDEELVFPDDYYDYDSEDVKSILQGFSNQINLAYKQEIDVSIEGEIDKVVIAGMGGSAIAGSLLQSFLKEEPISIEICRSYNLPNKVDKNTLVIISSYSGNTEETISTYKDALRKNCKIVIISTGGKLGHLSITNRTQIIKLPKGMQPRAALAYSFFPMLKLFEHLNIIRSHKIEVDKLVKALDKKVFMESGIKLSEKLINKIPLIYSGERFEPVTYRWRTQFNENSKIFAINSCFSELNHNEVEGLKNKGGTFHCIMLRTDLDNHRIVKRMDLTKQHYMKAGIDVTEISIKGDTLLTKIFSAIHMGDWTSYFLALRYKTDPSIYVMIEDFKKELGTFIS